MFTPVETAIGAVLLHQATSNLLYQNGNILGLSGSLRRLLAAPTVETLAFFTGMAASLLPLNLLIPELVTKYPSMPVTAPAMVVTTSIAALIGWGTKVRKHSEKKKYQRLTRYRYQTAARQDICSADFQGSADVLLSLLQRSSPWLWAHIISYTRLAIPTHVPIACRATFLSTHHRQQQQYSRYWQPSPSWRLEPYPILSPKPLPLTQSTRKSSQTHQPQHAQQHNSSLVYFLPSVCRSPAWPIPQKSPRFSPSLS